MADTIGISEVELARIAMARNVAGLAANTKTVMHSNSTCGCFCSCLTPHLDVSSILCCLVIVSAGPREADERGFPHCMNDFSLFDGCDQLTGSMAMSRGQLQAFHKAAGSFCAQVCLLLNDRWIC